MNKRELKRCFKRALRDLQVQQVEIERLVKCIEPFEGKKINKRIEDHLPGNFYYSVEPESLEVTCKSNTYTLCNRGEKYFENEFLNRQGSIQLTVKNDIKRINDILSNPAKIEAIYLHYKNLEKAFNFLEGYCIDLKTNDYHDHAANKSILHEIASNCKIGFNTMRELSKLF